MLDKNGITPGPWSEPGTYGATRFEVTGAGRRIAVIDRIEDARLIAAAPELLSALSEFLAVYQELAESGAFGGVVPSIELCQRLDRAEAAALDAIAKAEGRS